MKLKRYLFTTLFIVATVACQDDNDASKPTKPNTAPVAGQVEVQGTLRVGSTLTGSYSFQDADGDDEQGSYYQWYWKGDDREEVPGIAIPGATGRTYEVTDDMLGMFIQFEVTPKASEGVQVGSIVKSSFTSLIDEQIELTFVYNGQTVTYGVLRSPTTFRLWLDRNLGAAGVATSVNDWANYGDVFQWGRGADGHQLVTRTSGVISAPSPPASQNPLGVAAIGTPASPVFSSTDSPGHALFILAPVYEGGEYVPDWRSPKNDNLWALPLRKNNPCPPGWHVPTYGEFYNEFFVDAQDGFNRLKLTYTHVRLYDYTDGQGGQSWSDEFASYWTSDGDPGGAAWHIRLNHNSVYMNASERALGMACRCIKGE